MKKWVKITIISIISVLVLVGGCIGGYFIYLNHVKNENNPQEEEKPTELVMIEELADKVFNTLPNETSENIIFKNKFDGYEEFKIVYSTNDSPFMDSTGVITRDEDNHVVVVKFTITYKEISKEFGKNITVLKTSGMESMTNIVALLREQVPTNMDNNFVLPTKVDKYEKATITWKEEVINQSTGLVEPSIKVNKVDENYVVEFTAKGSKEICFLEAIIEYQGSTLEQRFVVYTKTTL